MLKPVRSHLAVDAGRAEEGGAAVLGAVAVGDAEAAPGLVPPSARLVGDLGDLHPLSTPIVL